MELHGRKQAQWTLGLQYYFILQLDVSAIDIKYLTRRAECLKDEHS